MDKEKNNPTEEINAFQQVNECTTDPDSTKVVPDEEVEEANDRINLNMEETPDRG